MVFVCAVIFDDGIAISSLLCQGILSIHFATNRNQVFTCKK